jgi:hypothetical protein
MVIIFFDIEVIVHKEVVRQAKQLFPHTTVALYGECLKMCGDFVPNFGDKRTGSCIKAEYRLTLPFSQGNFWPNAT